MKRTSKHPDLQLGLTQAAAAEALLIYLLFLRGELEF